MAFFNKLMLSAKIKTVAKDICYYSAVEKNINSLVTYPFCHDFCLKNTKFPPKLLRFQIYNPTLKHGAIDNQLDKPAE